MREALSAELLKVQPSPLLWITALAFTVAAVVCVISSVRSGASRRSLLAPLGDQLAMI